jgi:hypothetical protein
VIAVDDDVLFLVGVFDEVLNVAVVQMDGAGNMRLMERVWIADIDEQRVLAVELLFCLVNLDLRDRYRRFLSRPDLSVQPGKS